MAGKYDGLGNALWETAWLGDLPVAALTPAGRVFIAPDHLGSPHRITDPTGAVVWLWRPDPFGNGAPTGSLAYELRFPGQYFDQATKLHYNYFRDYDPRLGRYIESNPIGLAGGINTYAYVGGNPLSRIDPRGLTPGTDGAPSRWIGRALDALLNHICPTDDVGSPGEKKRCTLIGIKTSKWPGVPAGYKQCIYACKTDSGPNIIHRFVPEAEECPNEVDWVPGVILVK